MKLLTQLANLFYPFSRTSLTGAENIGFADFTGYTPRKFIPICFEETDPVYYNIINGDLGHKYVTARSREWWFGIVFISLQFLIWKIFFVQILLGLSILMLLFCIVDTNHTYQRRNWFSNRTFMEELITYGLKQKGLH